MSAGNVILTGFMGSGKSTIGRILAKELNTYFIDTDNLIEYFENRSIKEIFEKEGEESFRKKERYCFEWIKNNVKNTVISVGGGFPVFIPEIKEAGVVIYLKVDFDDILKRMSEDEIAKRPLFQDIKKAKELFSKRDNIYRQLADYIIENRDIDGTIKKIKGIIDAS
ncbi:shikimate kinase [Caminibacter pacificus]|uniref:Shikimate kinase n=1 Tax=Caminibacter pacificus TaxID=1424653 RepID=A0AAJ4RCX9_9BACT|nr:shikimate kinase [Caminibacter pacificus]QCI27729.1 shikimate kinase [Caminibacter pacificus]ROR40096.1 shikimate kinase [Caminibacter pacificus]